MSDTNPFESTFDSFSNLPFLFIGSGFSRRYMRLPNWEGLLRDFAIKIHPDNPLALEIFIGGDDPVSWPVVASRIEQKFNELWLTSPDYKKKRKKHQEEVRSGVSPFKIALSDYFNKSKKLTEPSHLSDELSCLTNVAKRSVAGIITTNYDHLLEDVFKGYQTYIGQEQLLFADTQGIAEIYKIHGCCSQAESIIINSKDYEAFNKRNAYLAAKLLTVFVEHPIIFIGYSISDPNVQSILAAITDCLSQKNLDLLKKRLIFIEFNPDPVDEPNIREHTINFEAKGHSLELTRITLHYYLPLFSELLSRKYTYNPKVLRQLKRDIYQLVTTNEPVDRFQIADLEDDENIENYEVLAGVGVTNTEIVNRDRGHRFPEAAELFRDVIFEDGDFEIKSLVENALAPLLKHNSNSLPLKKYIRLYESQVGGVAPVEVTRHAKNSLEDCLSNSLRKRRNSHTFSTLEELDQEAHSDEKKIELFPFLLNIEDYKEELGEFIKKYLTTHPEALTTGKAGVKTNLKRIIKIYDWLMYK